jgi:hypothetical protein
VIDKDNPLDVSLLLWRQVQGLVRAMTDTITDSAGQNTLTIEASLYGTLAADCKAAAKIARAMAKKPETPAVRSVPKAKKSAKGRKR